MFPALLRPAVAALAVILFSPSAGAMPVVSLEDFESGLGGVTTSGTVTLETSAFGITPLDASTNQAFLTTGTGATLTATTETDMGLTAGSIGTIFTSDVDPFSAGSGPTEGAALQLTFSGDAGDILEWDWAFVTNEVSDSPGNTPAAPGTYTDFAWYHLDFPSLSDGGAALTHANDAGVTFVSSSTSFLDEVAYTTVQLAIPETGSYTITVGVHDVEDQGFDSGLLVDAFRLIKGPEPTTGVLLMSGLFGMSWYARRRRA